MRVVWVHGAPAVGKSTVAWQLHQDLSALGWSAGLVDIDQLGMCYPARDDDPHRHRLKGGVLGALLPNYDAAGARMLVVSGVLDPALAAWLRGELAGAEVTFVRLVVGEQELRRRLQERGAADLWDAVHRADVELDAVAPLGPTVVTDGLEPSDVASAVRAVADLPAGADHGLGDRSDVTAPPRASHAAGTVTWLCGSTGVGKSTVAWHAFSALRHAGHTAALLDLRQLAFLGASTEERHALAAANVAAAWDRFAAAGATRLILSGSVDDDRDVQRYRAAMPGARMTVVRLRASQEDLAQRIRARRDGEGARLAGDELVGMPDPLLEVVTAEAWRRQQALDAAEVADVVLDSTALPPEDLARRLLLMG